MVCYYTFLFFIFSKYSIFTIHPFSEVGMAVRTLVRQQGFFGLWQGLSPSLLRDVPFSGIKLLVYAQLKFSFNNIIS